MRRYPLAALLGLTFTCAYFGAALLAPLIAPYGMAEVVGDSWEPSSAQFWLGTDTIGRDILSRLIYGAQITIFVALASSVLSLPFPARRHPSRETWSHARRADGKCRHRNTRSMPHSWPRPRPR